MKGMHSHYGMSLALALIWQLVLVSQLPSGDARSVSIAPKQQQSLGGSNNSTNASSILTSPAATAPGSPSVTSATTSQSSPSAVKHIRRSKRLTMMDIPFDFHTKHLACDVDIADIDELIDNFHNHCVWAYNNRHSHEGCWRVWQIYSLEGFLFGQYHERLKRYEIDPHGYVWPKGQ